MTGIIRGRDRLVGVDVFEDNPVPAYTGKTAKGAASELIAVAYFLRQGYYVYRSESPHAPFDLMIYKDGVSQRVEVKSVPVRLSPDGKDRWVTVSYPRNDEWDLLAFVVDESCVRVYGKEDHETLQSDLREVVDQLPHHPEWIISNRPPAPTGRRRGAWLDADRNPGEWV
jgi:hypothetical protein